MSEREPQPSPESIHIHTPEKSEEPRKNAENDNPDREVKTPDVAELRKEVTTEAVSGKELSPAELGHQESSQPSESPRQLKRIAFQKTMHRVQSQLKLPSRIGSKIIHQPTVDKVSSAAAKTIARPFSLMLGGLIAVIGSGFLLFASRHYGFSYNYLVIFGLFFAGWLVGLILEGLSKLIRHSKP